MGRYKARTQFNYYRLIKPDDVIELTEGEYLRLAHLVDAIPEYSEPVSTMDLKPDKKYRKGRRK